MKLRMEKFKDTFHYVIAYGLLIGGLLIIGLYLFKK